MSAKELKEYDDAPEDIKVPDNVLLRVSGLKKYFPIKAGVTQRIVGYVKAVDGVSFDLERGKTYGLVGESGCGKTTIGRTILRLTEPTAGHAYYKGHDLFALKKKELRVLRPQLQMIFQDPYSSLDPRMPIGEIIGEAVKEHNIVPLSEWHDYVLSVMKDCDLKTYQIDRYPHEFSGGQRQRICIARALALNPELIVADEPVSALDVSIQAQVINLMKDLQQKRGLAYLFISHDLSVVEYISDVVGVMYLGSLVEMAPKEQLFKAPLHPYTQALLSAVPVPDPDYHMNRVVLQGDLPSPANPPKGCKFHTRCQHCMEICKEVVPEYKDIGNGHFCACHLFDKQ
ncbi:MAG: dipeptide ABC transporter ATP-binding protein [Sphaerochaetaceae bacterium]|nr:dipeptide ABC transporter ATP-binding protein [Sphaerochaetaceae bacterium]MDD3162546.1 dipeptide ABC transporter ATP-binding protein [Sphaerochaetaceae bacterium]MDD4006364.1 dipeptide ABC transporter ATP-binding protein [Sphaerochaetaceae bacterium]MDD4396025.1 dipeptide ABC transporter ATP-binding protein [Sphaerochaetaceae bacterium]